MKFRTIAKAHQYIKEMDPETDVTPYLIRKLAEQEKVNLTRTGNKVLVDVDSVVAFLNGEVFTPRIMVLD